MKYLHPVLATTALFLFPAIATAQTYQPTNRAPVADRTLGTQVSGNGNNFSITGGVTKGQTLFHSFTDFSVPTNGQANFTNPVGNRDIITRVTGNLFSDINGTVNTNGANFFLINPNGIVLGTNARLNVGKAFVGSTANSIDLVDGSGRAITFGTNANGDAPLLSVAPNVLFDVSRLNLGGGNGAISNFGTLQTPNNSQYIGLIGGNVSLNGGKINAPGGRVELGGLSAPGTVGLGIEGNTTRAQFPANVARGDVSLTNQARVNVADAGGGDIAITAKNLEISSASVVRGGIETRLGTPEAVAGDIKIDATGELVIAGLETAIANNVRLNSQGNGGNITINTGSFSLRDGANLQASTFGRGNAGNVTVTVKDTVALSDANIFSTVQAGGAGKGGTITIGAGTLSLQDGAQLLTTTSGASATQPAGKGDAGNVNLKVSGAVDIAGTKDGVSGIFSYVETGAEGNGGNITIDAGSFSLRDGAGFQSSILGTGNAGNVTVTVKDAVSLAGSSYILSTVGLGGVGNGGNITINAGALSLSDGTQLVASTFGTGNAGNIGIKAKGDITLAGTVPTVNDLLTNANQSAISTSSFGVGDAGQISIDNPSGKLSLSFSNIQTTIGEPNNNNAIGISGGISINARELELKNNSRIISDLFGLGRAGNIEIKTTGDITISGNNQDPLKSTPFNLSAISSTTRGIGNSGKISIETPGKLSLNSTGVISSAVDKDAQGTSQGIKINVGELNLTDVGNIGSDTLGKNPGGDIDIIVKGAINIKNSSIQANSIKVTLNAPGSNDRLASSTGEGKAGNISISSERLNLNTGLIVSIATGGSGGNITIDSSDKLLLRNNSAISTSSGEDFGKDFGGGTGGGNGGNITINSPLIVALPAGNFGNDITANAFTGKGGNVSITSQGLFGIQYRPIGSRSTNDITASSDFGLSGNVQITTPGADPGRDSTELPNATTDASNQISQVCGANTRQNKLTVTGRGGLPPNANDPLTSDVVWQDPRVASSQPAVSNATNNSATLPPPAVGWVFDGNGKVTLVAAGTPGQPTGTRVVCPNVVR
jgi:filamentous hemagglutinin family protein